MGEVVYAIRCLPTGQAYVGGTGDWQRRKRAHLWGLREGRHRNKLLQEAFNRYGENRFRFEVLEFLEEGETWREAHWIERMNALAPNGFNASQVARLHKR